MFFGVARHPEALSCENIGRSDLQEGPLFGFTALLEVKTLVKNW